MTSDGFRVLIVGSGVTGCLLAQGLKKLCIAHSIFDREVSAAHYRPKEWTMGVHWGHSSMEDILPQERAQKLHEAQCYPNYIPQNPDPLVICDGATGEVIDVPPGAPNIRYPRRRLRAFLSEGLDIQYDKKLKDIETSADGKTVTIRFEDGTDAAGSLLVGCEGVHSVTREFLVGPEEAKSLIRPVCNFNFGTCYNDAAKALYVRQNHPSYHMATHPNNVYVFWASLDESDDTDPSAWKEQILISWLGDDIDRNLTSEQFRQLLIEKTKGFAEPYNKIVEWVPEGTHITVDPLHYWPPRPWDNRGGRVTLAGDAAHPMTPNRGQGLNHCIQDVAALVDVLGKVQAGDLTLKQAIERYEEEMIPRSLAEVQSSLENTRLLHTYKDLWDSPVVKMGLRSLHKDR